MLTTSELFDVPLYISVSISLFLNAKVGVTVSRFMTCKRVIDSGLTPKVSVVMRNCLVFVIFNRFVLPCIEIWVLFHGSIKFQGGIPELPVAQAEGYCHLGEVRAHRASTQVLLCQKQAYQGETGSTAFKSRPVNAELCLKKALIVVMYYAPFQNRA